nr:MAG TPA: hypothetical protein [Caudoviricetes sp.]
MSFKRDILNNLRRTFLYKSMVFKSPTNYIKSITT